MPETDDLSLLIDAAQDAGKIAARYFHGFADRWDKPGGQGPVTEADLAVDQMLREELTAARPDYGWLSEETEDGAERLSAEHVFIVDPIDGTRSFIEGSTTWAHSLAIARNGRVEAAVVYLPLRDKLYAAALGKGATLNNQPLAVSTRAELDGATVLAAKPNLAPSRWINATVPPISRKFRSSLAYRLSLVGEGRFDAMMTLHPTWEWDVAAGSLIVEEAGGIVSDRARQPTHFNNPVPKLPGMVAGGAIIHDALLTRLA
ncbi:myo-inositol-1(or 4)-monophosphatase [Aliiroseovarius sediminilitoris]|uniref:Myo-inositol-1(Or 4)-monophosphatase n=1 Tax=Aliiroseovarius sediminilitoris TaxID=1173584 RepID=A0A1I0MP77_9RHOB|nr:3'(2'),5'-bisphosphate nucleotidase CysQ [Aliiroseovarius sediminilitoris]SEV90323.1 myo-inositol-1(or 4)-monophosphatase [Aliiroseovarius sediminilitoris]